MEFVDGDPDRPLCMGHLWNALDPPQYPLPAQKTVTGHKSNSCPAPRASTVRLDDAAGAQEVSVNGHRDIVIHAANNKRARRPRTSRGRHRRPVDRHRCRDRRRLGVDGARRRSETVRRRRQTAVKVGADTSVTASAGAPAHVAGLEHLMAGQPADAVSDHHLTRRSRRRRPRRPPRAPAALLGPLPTPRGDSGAGPRRFLGPSAGLLEALHPSASLRTDAPCADGGLRPRPLPYPTWHSATRAPWPRARGARSPSAAVAVVVVAAVAKRWRRRVAGGNGGGGGGGGGNGRTWTTVVGNNVTEDTARRGDQLDERSELAVGGNAKTPSRTHIGSSAAGARKAPAAPRPDRRRLHGQRVAGALDPRAMAAFATNAASLDGRRSAARGVSAKSRGGERVAAEEGQRRRQGRSR